MNMVMRNYGWVLVGFALILASTAGAQITIKGIYYAPSGLCESVIAPFIPATPGPPGEPGADAVITTGSYSGLLELTVSGTGQSSSIKYNDAFYVYTDVPSPENDLYWYQLNVSTETLLGRLDPGFDYATTPPAQLARNKIVYDFDAGSEASPVYVPAYRQDHTYHIVVDLGTTELSQVHFGVADGIFSDNSGAYTISVCQLSRIVGIDIRPGSFPNSINPNAGGVIPVAVLSAGDFDASAVDPATVALNGVSARGKGKSGNYGSLEDVDGDGDLDLTVQVENIITWEADATQATLTANLYDGTLIQGSDSVNIVPPPEP